MLSTRPLLKEKILAVLNTLHSTLDHWDAIIRTEDKMSFRVHRCILSAASTYFQSLFAGPVSVSSRPDIEDLPCDVVVPKVTSEAMRCIVKFVYTGLLPLTELNVEELLNVTDRMLLPAAVRQCEMFLSDRIAPDNCVGIFLLSHQYFCLSLRAKARSYFLLRNCAVSRCEEYVNLLPFEELEDLLRDDRLNVRREDRVFHLVTPWVLFDRKERERHFPRLAHAARIGRCRHRLLEHILTTHELVKANQDVAGHIRDMVLRLTTTPDSFPVHCDEYYFRPRVPPEVIFVFGGWTRARASSEMEVFNARTNKWSLCSKCDLRPRAYHAMAVLEHHLYVLGGVNGRYIERSVRRCDLRALCWTEVAPLLAPRQYVVAVAYRGAVYALGGSDGGELRLRSVERYAPDRDCWEWAPQLNFNRSDAAAAVYRGHIFVAGGFDGESWLQSVEVYSDTSALWTVVAMMRDPRGSHALFVHRRSLYAVGGFNGEDRVKTMEKYDAEKGTWNVVFETKSAKSSCSVVVMEGRVYLIGGFNGDRNESTVQMMRQTKGGWKQYLKWSNMVTARNGLSACVLKSSYFNINSYNQ